MTQLPTTLLASLSTMQGNPVFFLFFWYDSCRSQHKFRRRIPLQNFILKNLKLPKMQKTADSLPFAKIETTTLSSTSDPGVFTDRLELSDTSNNCVMQGLPCADGGRPGVGPARPEP